MKPGPQLPPIVRLPDRPVLSVAEVRLALDASNAVLSLWRGRYAFPRSHRDGHRHVVLSDPLARWLAAHGAEVRRV